MSETKQPPPLRHPRVDDDDRDRKTEGDNDLIAAFEDWEEWNPSKGSFFVHACAGSFAGLAEHTLTFPIDTIKTYLQAEGSGGSEALAKVVQEQGRARLWRGVSTMMFGSVPAHALYFSIFEQGKIAFGATGAEHTPLAAGMAGALATIAHDSVMTPWDVIKQRMQLGYHSNAMEGFKAVARKEGLHALFRSFPVTLAMNVPVAAATVAANESFKRILNPRGDYSLSTSITAGALAGGFAGAVTTPLDVIRTRLQTQGLIQSLEEEQQQQRRQTTATTHNNNNNHNHNNTHTKALAASRQRVAAFNLSSSWRGTNGSSSAATATSSSSSGRGGIFGGGFGTSPAPGSGAMHANNLAFSRAKYTRPIRCPVPIAVWAFSPGSSTLTPPSAGKAHHHQTEATRTASGEKPGRGLKTYVREIRTAIRHIAEKDGYRGFWRGINQRVLTQAPAVAISWTAYESAKEAFRVVGY